MSENYFVIGDIHGELSLMKKMLSFWRRGQEQLVLIGDLADRGHDNKGTFLLAKKLVEEEGAIWVKGNHEDIILKWLSNPAEKFDWYRRNGGVKTINQLLDRPSDVEIIDPVADALEIKEKYPELLALLVDLPLYYETDKYIFVHAGVDLAIDDWHNTLEKEFYWIRDDFHKAPNTTGKVIVFGHTPTPYLLGFPHTKEVWYEDGKVGLDGGAVYGGVLFGVRFTDEGLTEVVTLESKKEACWED